MWQGWLRRSLDDGTTRSEIVELVPFDVTIGLTENTGVDVFSLTDIVEDWLGEAFDKNKLGEDYARFTTIILDNQDTRRHLQQQATTTFVASYDGVSVWTRTGNLEVPDETLVATIQTRAFLYDEDLLLASLQLADNSTGLGDYVTNVRASINSNTRDDELPTSSAKLDTIIIVAIAIAGVAFLLLGFALYMAWRHNKTTSPSRGEVTRKNTLSPEGTGEESEFSPSKRASAAANRATSPPMNEIEQAGGLYPESVISEDISTSLTAYYQSGMGGNRANSGRNIQAYNNNLNDAASVSSMESYGYSLDGYTNSVAPTNDKDEPY